MTDAQKLLNIAFECQKHPNDYVSIHQLREAFLETGEELPQFTAQLAVLLENKTLKRVRDDLMQICVED